MISLSFSLKAQEKKLDVQSYLTDMQSVMFDSVQNYWINDNLLHNRVNIKYYPNNKITANLEFRNRFMWGQSIQLNPLYAQNVSVDNGIVDLSWNILKGNSFLLNTSIDRAWVKYSQEKIDVKLGRQRINWGQTFAWNPNDIFNNSSFFDFDYAEKPGSDALRIQYYPTSTTTIDFTTKIDANEKITSALLYRFNKWKTDFQFMGGVLNQEDACVGFGWSGAIKNVSLRGEASFFQPLDNLTDTLGLGIISISADYSFKNESMLMVEAMYGNFPKISSVGFLDFYSAPSSVKNLSVTRYNFMAQYSYKFSPLLNASIAAMVMPEILGFYAGPTLTYSLKENLELSVIAQVFSGEFPNALGKIARQNFYMGFLKLKGDF